MVTRLPLTCRIRSEEMQALSWRRSAGFQVDTLWTTGLPWDGEDERTDRISPIKQICARYLRASEVQECVRQKTISANSASLKRGKRR